MSRTTPEARAAVQALMALPENAICADCKKRPTKWASSTLGVFICLECSGVHRGLGTHITFVRSCTLDGWTPEQARVMRRVGNANGNAWWESRLPPDYAPPCFDRAQMEGFIRAKYAERRWAAAGVAPHMQSGPAALVGTDGRANPSMYEGRFAHNPTAAQPPQMVFGRTAPAAKSNEAVKGHAGGVDLAGFMSLMQRKDRQPADDAPDAGTASAFDFIAEPTPAADPDIVFGLWDTSGPDPNPVTDVGATAESTATPSIGSSRAAASGGGGVTPRRCAAPRGRVEAPAGGSTAAEIMRQAAPGPKAKKQSLFGKKDRPRGAAAFMKKPGQPAPAAAAVPKQGGPSALDQMLAIVHTARDRPVSAPVRQNAPAVIQLGPCNDPSSRETDLHDLPGFRQQYPLAFPDPEYA